MIENLANFISGAVFCGGLVVIQSKKNRRYDQKFFQNDGLDKNIKFYSAGFR